VYSRCSANSMEKPLCGLLCMPEKKPSTTSRAARVRFLRRCSASGSRYLYCVVAGMSPPVPLAAPSHRRLLHGPEQAQHLETFLEEVAELGRRDALPGAVEEQPVAAALRAQSQVGLVEVQHRRREHPADGLLVAGAQQVRLREDRVRLEV